MSTTIDINDVELEEFQAACSRTSPMATAV